MERVDFYLVAKNLNAQQFACRLVNKAFNAGVTVRIELDTAEQAAQLDKLLWEFPQDCFIPHDLCVDEINGQSYIRVADLARLSAQPEMLLNLRSTAPEQSEQYQRIAEIVPENPDDRERMRERFRYYRELGCKPDYHAIS